MLTSSSQDVRSIVRRFQQLSVQTLTLLGAHVGEINGDLVAETSANLFETQTFGLWSEFIQERNSTYWNQDEDEVVFPTDGCKGRRRRLCVNYSCCQQRPEFLRPTYGPTKGSRE